MAVMSFLSRDIVVPATPTHRHSLFLSCFDISWKGSHYMHKLIFYESTKGLSSGPDRGGGGAVCDAAQAAVMEKLKSSLALCLVHYYPCCGRLAPGDRLFIDCNDAGVEFVEASVDLPISHLSHHGFQTKPFLDQLYPKLDHSGDLLYSSPLLSIQATFFSDGGLALGITLSHVVADGKSLWDFMVSWGECARGLPLSLPPLLDRQILAVPKASLENGTWELNPITLDNDIKQEEETADQHNEDTLTTHSSSEAAPNDPSATAGTSPSIEETQVSSDEASTRIPCFFNLSSSAVKQLKLEDGGVHTSYEVTCAHLWQRLTAARRRPFHEPTHFFVIASCRSRLSPPLPPAFFGNAIVFGITVSISGKIGSESLHATANRIHDTVVEITQESYVKRFMHWMESHDNDLMRVIIPRIPKGKGVNVAASPRFPVYEVDFGWGKPVAVRSPKMPEDGEMVFSGGHPKSVPGDVEICAGLPSYVLRHLLEDPSFLAKAPCSPFEDE